MLDQAKNTGSGISGIGGRGRKVRDCSGNNPEVDIMGTKGGKDAGDD